MTQNKILHLNLKKEWFDKIKTGEKTIEYREVKPYWTDRLCYSVSKGFKEFDKIIFKNGYQKNAPKLEAKLLKIELLQDGLNTDLKIDKPVYAIYFKLLGDD